MQSENIFSLPEQMATVEILSLIQRKKMEIVNFKFFSRIESSPLKPIIDPMEREMNKEMYEPATPYLQTTVSCYCRGTKVAEVVIEGYVIHGASGAIDSWRTAKIRARRYYWRDDKDENQTWEEFTPIHQFYEGVKAGTDEEERCFLKQIEEVLRQ